MADAILSDKKARFIFVTLTIENVRGEVLRDTIDEPKQGVHLHHGKEQNFRASEEAERESARLHESRGDHL